MGRIDSPPALFGPAHQLKDEVDAACACRIRRVARVRSRTGSKIDSIGFDVRKLFQCSRGKS